MDAPQPQGSPLHYGSPAHANDYSRPWGNAFGHSEARRRGSGRRAWRPRAGKQREAGQEGIRARGGPGRAGGNPGLGQQTGGETGGAERGGLGGRIPKRGTGKRVGPQKVASGRRGNGKQGGALEPTKPPVRTGDLGTGRGWKRELPGDVERTRPVGFKTRTSLVGPPRGSCCFFTFIGGRVFPMRQLLRQVWRQPYPFDLGDSCLAMPVLRRATVRAHEAQPPSLGTKLCKSGTNKGTPPSSSATARQRHFRGIYFPSGPSAFPGGRRALPWAGTKTRAGGTGADMRAKPVERPHQKGQPPAKLLEMC